MHTTTDATFHWEWEYAMNASINGNFTLAMTMCQEMLGYDNLPLLIRAACHLLLAEGPYHFVWHAQQSFLGYSLLAEREPENPQLERLVNLSRCTLLQCIESKECGRRIDFGEQTEFDPEYDAHFTDAPTSPLPGEEFSDVDTSDTDWDDHDFSDGPWPLSDDELSEMSDEAVESLLTT